jgi:hypothetical protein
LVDFRAIEAVNFHHVHPAAVWRSVSSCSPLTVFFSLFAILMSVRSPCHRRIFFSVRAGVRYEPAATDIPRWGRTHSRLNPAARRY